MPLPKSTLTKRKSAKDEIETGSTHRVVPDEAAATSSDACVNQKGELTIAQQSETNEDWVTTDVLQVMNARLKEEMAHLMDSKLDALLQALQLDRSKRQNETSSHQPQSNSLPVQPSRTPSPTDTSTTRNSSIHYENELVKEIMKQIPRYDGTGNTQKLFEFIDNVELYLSTAEVTSRSELNLAVSKLTGDARMWWRDHQQRVPLNSPERTATDKNGPINYIFLFMF